MKLLDHDTDGFWVKVKKPVSTQKVQRGETILFVTHNVDEAVFLSDQIIVLSKRPARIIKVLEVGYPKAGDRTSKECNKIRRDVLRILEEEMRRKEGGNENCWDIL